MMAEMPPATVWRHPGASTPEVRRRRNLFLETAATFRPPLLEEYQAMRPAAKAARDALVAISSADYVSWGDVEAHATVPGVADFHAALPGWASRWHLVGTEGSGEFASCWVLEATAEVLCNDLPDHPFPLRLASYSWTPPVGVYLPPFDVVEWGADEEAHVWRSRWQAKFKAYLNAHIRASLGELAGTNAEPVPRKRSEQDTHVELAARWQVGGEEWGDFLAREGLDGSGADEGATVSNVRNKILGALDFTGTQVRSGMRTT